MRPVARHGSVPHWDANYRSSMTVPPGCPGLVAIAPATQHPTCFEGTVIVHARRRDGTIFGSGLVLATYFPGSRSLSNCLVSVGESIRLRKLSGISVASPELMEWPSAKCDARPSTFAAASSRAWASDAASMMTTSPPKNESHHMCVSPSRVMNSTNPPMNIFSPIQAIRCGREDHCAAALRMSSAVASSPQCGSRLAAVDAAAETIANLRARTSFAACPPVSMRPICAGGSSCPSANGAPASVHLVRLALPP
jgi:hypothetical protein